MKYYRQTIKVKMNLKRKVSIKMLCNIIAHHVHNDDHVYEYSAMVAKYSDV